MHESYTKFVPSTWRCSKKFASNQRWKFEKCMNHAKGIQTMLEANGAHQQKKQSQYVLIWHDSTVQCDLAQIQRLCRLPSSSHCEFPKLLQRSTSTQIRADPYDGWLSWHTIWRRAWHARDARLGGVLRRISSLWTICFDFQCNKSQQISTNLNKSQQISTIR